MNHLKQILIFTLLIALIAVIPVTADDDSPSVDEQISALIEQLDEGDYTVAIDDADQLQRIGPASIPYLAKAMESDNQDKVTYASLAIRRFGVDALPELLEALASEKAFTRYSAAATISWMKYDASIAIGPLVWMLEDEHPDVRAQAAVTLGAMGKAAKSVEHSLADSLRDIDPQVRDKAALALEKIGADTDDTLKALGLAIMVETTDAASSMASALATYDVLAIPPLTLALSAESPFVRASAVYQLGKLADGDDEIISEIIRMFEDEDIGVRTAAARAVGFIGPSASDAIPFLIDALYERYTNDAVILAFSEIGKDAVPDLVDVLDGDNTEARIDAAYALGSIGPDATDAVQALITALDAPDVFLRIEAIKALGQIGPAAEPAVQKLIGFLENDNGLIVWNSARSLGSIGPGAESAIPAIIDAYNEPQTHKSEALIYIYQINPEYEGFIPVLIEALDSDKDPVAYSAGEILINLGDVGVDVLLDVLANGEKLERFKAAVPFIHMPEVPEEAMSILRDMLYEEDLWSYGTALRVFSSHQDIDVPVDIVSRLISLMEEPDNTIEVAKILKKLGPAATDAVPSLLDMLKSDDYINRRQAAITLGSIGVASDGVVPALMGALSDEEDYICQSAAKALGKIGPDASDALPALRKAVKGWSEELRVEAAMAIYRITGESWEAVIALTEELWAFSTYARLKAIEYLGKIGPDASDALPRLYEMDKYETDDSFLREDILKAIGKIEGTSP